MSASKQAAPEPRTGAGAPRIVILGAAGIDAFLKVDTIPQLEQTVDAAHGGLLPGGKGLNQAIAASRLGCRASLVSVVGKDLAANLIGALLSAEGVDARYVKSADTQDAKADGATPITAVLVDGEGRSTFVMWRNPEFTLLSPEDVQAAEPVISASSAMVVTLELPLASVEQAIMIASKAPNRPLIVLDPAPPLQPPNELPRDLLKHVTCITPNVSEAYALIPDANSPAQAAKRLASHGIEYVCVTAGADGCMFIGPGLSEPEHVPSFPVDVRDGTGAGDAFSAAITHALLTSRADFSSMIRRANAAGGLAARQYGGSSAMPTSSELDAFLAAHSD